MTSPKPERLHGLDTLRSLAIVSVMIFHLQPFLPTALDPIKRIGWMGVDLFFVLSGFLIGSQLLKPSTRNQPPNLRAFYIRRAYRILPAYLAVLLLYFTIPQWREHELLPSAWKLLTFTADFRMNYPAELAFSHVWSLCVEEHFYLMLPWIILWLMRKPAAWKTAAFIASVIVFGVAIRSYELFHVVRAPGMSDDEAVALFMKRIYYPTYTRLDGLLSGATLATIRIFRPIWWAKLAHRGNALLIAGLLIFGVAVWTFRGDYPSPDRTAGILLSFPLLSLGFAFLVAAAIANNGLLRLRLPGAAVLATLAFSLYLTHKEVAHMDQLFFPWLNQESGWRAACVYAATCLAVAALLYSCVERPFLILRDRHLQKSARPAPSIEARLDPAL